MPENQLDWKDNYRQLILVDYPISQHLLTQMLKYFHQTLTEIQQPLLNNQPIDKIIDNIGSQVKRTQQQYLWGLETLLNTKQRLVWHGNVDNLNQKWHATYWYELSNELNGLKFQQQFNSLSKIDWNSFNDLLNPHNIYQQLADYQAVTKYVTTCYNLNLKFRSILKIE